MPKPSDAPWADEPFALISLPAKRPEYAHEKHSCVWAATLMSEVHNVLIRGLNSIIQQGPYVEPPAMTPSAATDSNDSPSSPCTEKDTKDFLTYVANWVHMVDHHHSIEESFIFPELDAFAGVPGLMDDPKHQHALFHDGLIKLLTYAETTQSDPKKYSWGGEGGMKAIIDEFSKPLIDHLYDEINVFLSLKNLDSEGLRKTVQRGDDAAKKHGSLSAILYKVFPCVLGCHDKLYEGGTDFPPFPRVLIYAVKYWFAVGNGAWRFSPCDLGGQPRPLAFGPKSSQE